MKVLIVEDNQFTQLALIQALAKAEYDVHAVMNGEDAVLRVIDEEFDTIVTDNRIPQMGGLELTSILRRLFGVRLRIIGMSASEDCRD